MGNLSLFSHILGTLKDNLPLEKKLVAAGKEELALLSTSNKGNFLIIP